MRFSTLLSHLSGVTETTPRHLAADPDLQGAHALDQAMAGQLSFLEPGNALTAALAATGASAVLIPAKGDEALLLQQQASARGLAWVALADPRLGFAEALDALYPRPAKPAGIHPSAVVDPSAQLDASVHIGPHVVIGAAVQVGAGCTIHANATLYDDVVLQEGCEIHSGAVLHPGSRLGRSCVVHSNAVVSGSCPPPAAGARCPRPDR